MSAADPIYVPHDLSNCIERCRALNAWKGYWRAMGLQEPAISIRARQSFEAHHDAMLERERASI